MADSVSAVPVQEMATAIVFGAAAPTPARARARQTLGGGKSSPKARLFWADLVDSEDEIDVVPSNPGFATWTSSAAQGAVGAPKQASFVEVSSGSGSEAEPDSAVALTPALPQPAVVGKSSTQPSDHAPGSCKQCVFFFSPAGCTKGEDCNFCHVSYGHCFNKRQSKTKRDRYRKLLAAKVQAAEHVAGTPSGCAAN
mmetsp:Transcript_60605/g.153682  ORF Transcript_60605/g.153682 Transcript_60605/m.153682 type:complete len:197 (-) Transcript_60605:42-632(-)